MKHLNNWMRALRRSVLCACVAVACVWCLPSCNDDKIGDVSLIYGRWEATSFSGYEKEEGEESPTSGITARPRWPVTM